MFARSRIALIVVTTLACASAGIAQRAAAQTEDAGSQTRSSSDSARAYGDPASVYNAHRIARVIDDGSRVMLADGTIWEIYLPDRPSVNTWRAGDLLIVRESSVSEGEYDYTLKDGRTRGAVYARLVADARARS